MATSIPLGLKQALESGECVLFIGAGIGRHLKGIDGKPAPDGAELSKELAAHFGITPPSENLAKIAQVVEGRKGRQTLEDYLRKRLAKLEPDKELRWLFTLRWRAIFTTNYDSSIQRAYELNEKPLQQPISIASTSDLVSHDPRFEVPIYHLHGALFGGRSKIVITKNDYAHFRDRRHMLFELLKKEFATSNILYIGYSNQDQNWDLILEELTTEFYPKPLPPSYRVSPASDPLDVEILKSKGIETIDCDYEQFADFAALALSDMKVDPDRLKRIQSKVPSHLASAFEKNPAAVARLLSSWVYVNQAPFDEAPNTDTFLKGDRPNWASIAHPDHFTRDIEEDLYDEVLDYVTGSPTRPSVITLLGSAGYGMTTVLMSLAVKFVRENVGPVFMHKPGAQILEGDILFATALFQQPPIILVDDAADSSIQLQSALGNLRGNNRPAVLLLAERLNEWRQSKARIGGKEFLIEALSDTEINRLLDCLARHNALNKLEPLTRELQFAVIKEKHGKELLVAMKEATEGKGFDAIIEDEYRGLSTDLARSAYLAVCCFYQHGAYARDSLLAQLLRTELPEFYEHTKAALDGVVMYDEIDEARSIYGARARHKTIATIVWERCGERAEKDNLLQKAIESINLMYGIDRDVFEKFIRSDRLVDSIRGLDRKTQFFETACKKDPENPYIRQHYARMLSREDKAELALSQIDEGLKLTEKTPTRVLFHTKGVILAQLARTIESEDVARKRLVQSEEAFRRAISLNPRDEYGYQGLAQLCLDWAKRAKTDAESAEYISRAEEIISDGLKRVITRDGLWITSSEIEKWLGDTPGRLKALERAIQANPGNVIARYLLGVAYRKSGRADLSLNVLEPVIKGYPDEFRSFVEYALALLDTGKSLAEAIAVLRISTTFGLGDPRFIATLGGMLFINGEFDEATKVFQESIKREFPATEIHTVHYRPKRKCVNDPYELEGKILIVKPGYSLIEVEGYPKFLCLSSKYAGLQLKPGMKVQFAVEFSAKGAIADRPAIIN